MKPAPTSSVKSWLLVLSAGIFALDQWSKYWIELRWERFDTFVVIPGWFNLIHVKNTGIAFGLFPSRGEFFGTFVLALFGTLAMVLVAVYFSRTPSHRRLLLFALALVLGGALGNLVDRVVFKQVTDFFDVYYKTHHFPTFNVADSAITVGIICLLAESLLVPGDVAQDGAEQSAVPSEGN